MAFWSILITVDAPSGTYRATGTRHDGGSPVTIREVSRSREVAIDAAISQIKRRYPREEIRSINDVSVIKEENPMTVFHALDTINAIMKEESRTIGEASKYISLDIRCGTDGKFVCHADINMSSSILRHDSHTIGEVKADSFHELIIGVAKLFVNQEPNP